MTRRPFRPAVVFAPPDETPALIGWGAVALAAHGMPGCDVFGAEPELLDVRVKMGGQGCHWYST